MNRLIHSSFIILLSFIYISCSSNTKEKIDEKKIFRYNESEGITSLDPAFSRNIENIWACNQLYNGLVQMDDELHVKPCIAKSWNISEDGKIYTFNLRNDVTFHNNKVFKDSLGRNVTAYDFEYSFNRILSEKVASPGKWIFNNVEFVEAKNFKAFEAINDTIEIDDVK